MNAYRLAQFGLPALFLYVAFAALQLPDETHPPWVPPPEGGVNFTVPGVEDVPDLHGEINDPDLVVFWGGNQFMVVPELIKAFQGVHPECKRIFCETLPPGILEKQIKTGSLVIGNLKVTLEPDIFVAGQERIDDLDREGHFEETLAYCHNRLAIMVHKNNPKNISSLEDLGRFDVRVSMPNPETEGIARKAAQAYQKAGGKRLVTLIMEEKVKNGTTFVTQIHHRQTPIRIMDKKSDAGPVWYTEAVFQQTIGNPIGLIEIPGDQNIIGITSAGVFRDAPHKEAALAFIDFLTTEKAQRIYRQYGFLPIPSLTAK